MPRRKGHGIPPTKRIKAEQNVAAKTTQKSSKGTEKDGENIQVPSKSEMGKAGIEPQVAPKSVNGNGGGSSSSDAEGGSSNSENNYLHKKFKKIAATAALESNLPITNGVDCASSNRPKEDETQDESKVISGGRYMCPYCKLACAKPSVLEKHIRAHTNERPYPCVPCGFAFKTKSNLYKHCRSRAHAVKVGEADTDEPGKCQDAATGAGAAAAPELSGSDDDSSIDHHAQAQARLNQVSPVTCTGLPPTPPSPHSISVADFQKKIDDRISKTIYKPKFHTTSLYAENSSQSPVSELSTTAKEGWPSDTPVQTNSLSLKMPQVDRAPLSENSVSSPFTSCSSPSPEFLQRHISKLISDNQAIVETMDPIWPKKFLHRSNSKEASHSPSSPFTTLASDTVLSLKKSDSSEVVQSFTNYSSLSDKISEHHSKLALALLRPSDNLEHNYRTPSPLMQDVCNDQQPLNLTTNSSKFDQTGSSSRKRSYSEGFPYGLTESELPPQSSIKLIKSTAGLSRAVPSELNISLDSNSFHVKYMNNMMSNSVMKDSTFKSNIPTGAHEIVVTESIKSSSNSKSNKSQSLELRYVCQTCNIQCKNAQVLGIHQMYYCKGNEGSMGHDKLLNDDRVQSKSPQKGEGPVMIAPPFPSPGPLLGNTPLVDSYMRSVSEHKIDRKSPFKKVRHDSDVTEDTKSRPLLTTLRSLEELSKSPMKNNLHMFGGEVKILDNTSGEAKTMRIEPSNRGSQGSSEIILDISSASGYKDKLNNNESGISKEKVPQIVNIAKTGFHSGGTIVQVPHKMPNSQEANQERSSKSGTKDLSSSHVTPPNISNSKYPSSNNLIIPIIPNIVTPSLTVAGVASPVQLPLAPFTPIIADKSIINPLTSITGYNPLTLPPAPLLCTTAAAVSPSLTPIPAPYTGGIVTILHGGKAIPYVPGMPGPHTLLQTSPALASSPSELPRNNKVSEHSKTDHGSSEPQSNDSKNQRTHSGLNSPTSSDGKKVPIPSIKLDSAENHNKAVPDAKQSTSMTVKIINNRRSSISPISSSSASSVPEKNADKSEEETSTKNANERRFLRPTSLPLKPGTFTPKKLSTPNSNILPLVSPETPRPRKSYGQLYLNGHAYTYLGLKCSTRVFFCTLNKPQPIYVPLTPEHSNISMYSNWKIRSDADPNPFGLEPGQAMAHYDSRHRPTSFTVASTTKFEAVTHSSQWKCCSSTDTSLKTEPANKLDSPEEKDESLKENPPKRIKIFDGGFESNEDYIYVRGRGRGRYVCEECGIRCKKPSMLKKHIRTHTDVRPFTCKHCNFSFKTKGNLTKHMKSKAHFKKCTELGIDPVPIIVDDTHINVELLARQQAMRADRGLDPNLTDEDEDAEEEEEEEDDDEEEEDDDDVDVDGDDDDYEDEWNSRLEQDAARSLLSLSKVPASTAAQSSAVRGGLVPPHGRPHTYPYSHPLTTTPLSHPHHTTQPQTPTLSAISAQREREKVSQNTGLARVHPDEPPAQVERSEAGVASRYYFPSTRNLQDDKTTTSPDANRNESTSYKETTDSEKNPPPSCPMDLSYKSSDESRARTCEAALLLASLCSTVDALPSTPTPVADVSEDSQLLQAYLTERAVKQQNMKQHQYHRPQVTVLYTGTNSIQTIDSSKTSPTEKPSLDGTFTTNQDKSKFLSISKAPNFHVESLIRPTPPEPVAASHSNPAQDDDESDKESSTQKSQHGHDLADSVDDAKNSPSSEAPPSKKPKAEFIPPSNGPPPNYVSVLEDGRSMCLICNKLFTKPSQLWLHVNIHYFERPFRCESCAVSFRTKGHLQKHQRSVTHMNKMSMNSTFGTATTSNPRPFKCDDCKIAFRIHGHLAKHLRSKMHIMKLECLGKLPFGTYAEMERSGINMNDIDTTDCDNSLESLQLLAQKLIEKDPSKLGQWDPLIQRSMSTGDTSSEEEDTPAAILSKHSASAVIQDATYKGPSPKSNELLPTIFNSSTVISNSSDVFALSQHPKTDSMKTVIQRGSQLVYGEPKKCDESGNVLLVSAPIGGSFPVHTTGESGLPRPSTANSVLVPSTRSYAQPIGRFTTKLLMNSSQVSERTRDSTVVSAIRSKVETNSEKNCSL